MSLSRRSLSVLGVEEGRWASLASVEIFLVLSLLVEVAVSCRSLTHSSGLLTELLNVCPIRAIPALFVVLLTHI